MNKLKLYVSFVAISFLFLIPFNVSAQSLPTVNSFTVNEIETVLNNALLTQFLSKKIYPYLPEDAKEIIQFFTIDDPVYITSNDCNVRPLTSSEIDSLNDANVLNFYDENGNSVNLEDSYIVHYDNGYFNGDLYCDDSGNLLYLFDDVSGSLLTVRFGGLGHSLMDWEEIYQDLAEQIENNNFAFTENDVEITPQTYFYWFGNYANYRPTNAHYYYCANEYNPGVIMRMPNESGRTVFYTNYPDSLIYQCTLGNPNNEKQVSQGDFYYNAIHYSYKIVLGWDGNYTVNNTYESWVNSVGNSVYNRYFAAYGTRYDSSLAQNATSASMFKPITYENDLEDAMDISSTYAADDLEDAISNVGTGVRNPAFDGRNALSDTNYPFAFPISTSIPVSTLPLVGESDTVVDPALSYPETIQPTPEIVTSSFENFGIPFFSNLQYRYPFSIPWDIQKFIQALKSDPEPPSWDFDYTITIGDTDYTKHFEGDLSDFNSLAELFRNLTLIGFVLALCKFSYDHHF